MPSEDIKPKDHWRTLREDLDEWREANDVDDSVFNGLLAILEKHRVLRAA